MRTQTIEITIESMNMDMNNTLAEKARSWTKHKINRNTNKNMNGNYDESKQCCG